MSWHENLVNTIRSVIFTDEELKTLMMIPEDEKDNIVAFRDKYFINTVTSDEVVGDIPVRITYRLDEPMETSSPNVVKNRLYFDIFVETKNAYNYGKDRMLHRGDLIADRLNHLLGGKRHHNITFRCRGIYDMTSRREGFDRKTIVFMYKRIFT